MRRVPSCLYLNGFLSYNYHILKLNRLCLTMINDFILENSPGGEISILEYLSQNLFLFVVTMNTLAAPESMEKSGRGRDGIFRSLRPPLVIPTDSNTSMISFLFRNTSSSPNKPALFDSDSGDTLTFSEIKTTVAKFSYALNTQFGITKNDVVLIFAPNSIQYPICSYSIIALGAIVTTANPQYTVRELSKQIEDSNPKLIFTVQELYPKVENFGLPVILLGPESSINGCFSYKDLISKHGLVSELPKVSIRGDDTAALLYSSGTTGVSKGVILSHKNFIAASQMVTIDQRLMGEKHYVHLCFLPMFHIFGFAVILYAQLQEGNTVVSMGKFSFEGVLKNIEKYRVTHLWVVPPVVLALTKQDVVKKFDLSSLKFIISGAAPLGKELIEECAKKFPHVFVLQGYGMTETTTAISLGSPILGPRDSGSTGMLVPGIEALIVSVNTLKPLLPNQTGEIWVRGDSMMQGYLNNPHATKLTLDKQGFVHTGDLGYFDDEGQLFVVDRVKELIKYKGFQVAPAELEAVLISHSEILDAAVVPFPDDESGEIPIAFVVQSSKGCLKEEDVKRFVDEQVAPYKRLRRVIFVNNIPKSASGKLLRRVLVQDIRSRM
ncbi:hypothetical protein LXL04_004549 [Taraxacum kok-saghyz]